MRTSRGPQAHGGSARTQEASDGRQARGAEQGSELLSRTLRTRLARGALSAFLVTVAGTGLGFVAQIVLARVLGAQGFGVYEYVMAWVSILAMVATLGFQNVLLRFAAVYSATEQWAALRGLIRYADVRVGLAGVLVGGATVTAVVLSTSHLAPDLVRTFLVAGAVIPLFGLLMTRSSLARAFGFVVIALAPQTAVRHATVIAAVGIYGLAAPALVSPQMAMATMLGGTALGLAVVSVALRRTRPRPLLHASPGGPGDEWRRAAVTFLAIAGIQMFLSRAGILMIGWLADTTAAGIYAAVAGIAGLVLFALTAVNTIFAPNIAALHAQGDHAGLQSMVTMTARWTAAAALITTLPLFALAEPVLGLFGPEFVAGGNALRILLLGQVVNAAAGSVGALLGMTGHERRAAAVLAVTAVVQVGLHLLLIPEFGLIGAATAAAVTIAAWNLAFGVLVWRQLGIVPSVFARR